MSGEPQPSWTMAKPEESWASTILSQFGIAVSADLDKDTKIPSTLPYTCEQCESIGTNRPSQYDPSQSCNYCNGCNEIYCNKCWAAQGPHRRNTLTITGVPHEKTDPNVADLVRATLQSNPSKDEQQRLYQDDENATWFGLVEIDGEPTFRDYGRYVDLMGQIVRQPSQRQYPSLVSFVGPAGTWVPVQPFQLCHKRPVKNGKCCFCQFVSFVEKSEISLRFNVNIKKGKIDNMSF